VRAESCLLELCRTGANSRANVLNVAKWQSGEMADIYSKKVSQNGTQFKIYLYLYHQFLKRSNYGSSKK
jgi:hypothetical protein